MECKALLTSIETKSGWYTHPCTQMWVTCEAALVNYAIEICKESRSRNCNDQMLPYFENLAIKYGKVYMPYWLGQEDFHASHRSNLLRKLPSWYKWLNWKEPDNLPYVWPIPCLLHPAGQTILRK